ncbi:MAG TPA: biotin--[acetyl-CoA-carboxylase] ligase [Jatrophihabitans sp.]|nr:biotin--[acetyl-CoA-carboxylase] ligase [Jatrophihabitans sp.]
MDRVALDTERLRRALQPRWARIDVVDEAGSTNADLLADATAPDRSVLAAEHQVAGRGRFNRVWTSPPRAGLTFSVLLRPDVAVQQWGWLPLLAGLALHEAVDAVTGLQTRLKWPNDLLAADGRKLAGILAQTSGDADAVVIGIGLNVDTSAAELPGDAATSLVLAGAPSVDRSELLTAVLTRLDARFAQWSDCHGEAEPCGLAQAYTEACATIGRHVRVALPDGALEGDAVAVDPVGRLVVRTPAAEQVVAAGDVEHVRSA